MAPEVSLDRSKIDDGGRPFDRDGLVGATEERPDPGR